MDERHQPNFIAISDRFQFEGHFLDATPFGAKLITYEQSIRFLTDHINGDIYYKIGRENHNLDRGRTQIKMVRDMEQKFDQMSEIVQRYR